MDDDENDKDYEMNMEKIMAKFTNFNTSMSSKSNNSQDNDEEEDDETEIHRNDNNEEDEDKKDENSHNEEENNNKSSSPQKDNVQQNEESSGSIIIPSEFKEPEPLQQEYADNEYWRPVNILGNTSVDDLLADYE